MKNLRAGFTLIELLVVIAIIGILAAVALPLYDGYKVRAKMLEVQNGMMTLKSAISAYHQDDGTTWPSCATLAAINTTLGVGLDNIKRISAVTVVNGEITTIMRDISPLVDGKSLKLTPNASGVDGSISWTWGWSNDLPLQFRPKGN